MTQPCVCIKQHEIFRRRRDREQEDEIDMLLFSCVRIGVRVSHRALFYLMTAKKKPVSLEINDGMKNEPSSRFVLSLSLCLTNSC